MNWEAIGAIGEVAGAIAVVVTLVYFSVQIRQSSSSIHSQTSWSVTQALDHLNAQSVGSAEVTDIFLRGCEDPSTLDANELARFRSYVLSWLNLAVYIYHHPTPEHEFYIPYLASMTAAHPGVRMIVDEIEFSFPRPLYEQLTASTAGAA